MQGDTLPKLLLDAATRFGNAIALQEKRLGEWRPISWRNYSENVKLFALGLASLGVKRGDRVAILSHNCPEWLYADLAIQSLGGVSVGIDPLGTTTDVSRVLDECQASLCITGDHEQTDKVLEGLDRASALKKIIVVNGRGLHHHDSPILISFREVMGLGMSRQVSEPGFFEKAVQSTQEHDKALMGFELTAGGSFKLLALSHKEIIAAALRWLSSHPLFETDSAVSYLPLCFLEERMLSAVLPLKVGYAVSFASDSDALEESLRSVSPSLILGTSKALSALADSSLNRIAKTKGLRRWACNAALSVGTKVVACRGTGKNLSMLQRVGQWLARVFVLRPIMGKLGLANTQLAFCTDRDLAENYVVFYASLGLSIVSLDQFCRKPRANG
jgi:long-chain acyl-CoA synthetase